MSTIENVSRRQFIGGVFSTGAFVLAARVLPDSAWAQTAAPAFRTNADGAALNPSVYLGIQPDGTVFIVTHRSEMGTGIRTTLPMVAADELDADWSRVRIEQGIGDARYGDQNTDGSRSIRDFYVAFRRGRCVSAVDARERGGGAVERAGVGVHDVESRGRASVQRTTIGLRRARAGGGEAARAEGGEPPVQAEDRLAARRSGDLHLRSAGHRHRQGAVRSRRVPRRHGLRLDRASAGARRHGEERQRQRGARREGRAADGHARHLQAAASLPAARRCGGDRRQHVGGAAGPAQAEGRLERWRARRVRIRGVQEAVDADGEPAGEGRAQSRQRGRRVREGRQGARGDLLHAAGRARVDGAAGRGRRSARRQGDRSGRRRRIRRRCRTPWPPCSASTRRT